jgi:RimJ/RimL family protein N-acetyltransferase
MSEYRTAHAGTMDESRVGDTVTVAGWVQRRRDHGGVSFFDLRDSSGIVQVVADPAEIPVVNELRMEYCVSVTGEVRMRPEGTVNEELPTGMVEIGWRLREDAWGHGYAKEAALACLALAFERFGADEVVALTVEGNSASWGLMKRLGMRRRVDLDYPDHRYDPPWRDTIVYSIDRSTWERAVHDPSPS